MDWQEFALDNGVRVIHRRFEEFHSCAAGVWIMTGSRYETDRLAGISHFLEHLFFKGTRTRTYRQIKETIEGVGGSFNGFTAEEATAFWIKILNRYLDRALDVLADMMRNSLLQESDVNRERTVIREEIRMYRDQPAHYVHDVFDQLLFGRHGLGRSIVGTEESIRAIDRPALTRYVAEQYTGRNIVVSVCGSFSEAALEKTVRLHFGGIPAGRRNTCSVWKPPRGRRRVKILHKKTEQVNFCLGGYSCSRFAPERYSVSLLTTILGGNMSSRLFNEVREKRSLAYDVRSSAKESRDTGAYVVSAGVAPGKSRETLRIVVREMDRLREKLVGERELTRAKRYLVSQLLMGLEDNLEYMMWLGEQRLLRSRLVRVRDAIASLERVTGQDIRKAAQELFRPSNYHLALIGPEQDEESFLSVLERG